MVSIALCFFFNRIIQLAINKIFSDNADGNVAVDTDDTDTEDGPRVTLAEMLDDLHIAEDATGEAGAPMMD